MKSISEIILRRLDEKDISQSELARRLGVNRAAVNFWCSGRFNPRISKLERIADVLDIEVKDFFIEN
ncbi:MAG: transcriptional regulator [Parcubacteria group bacterium]|jgi:transcriptional regulator with XRE-family HTH domain|nr:transcriptional regulator [Parcubacteria group bacterium]|tara:strand:+ start:8181 stop:8381 length:201 start_codon:yes stop_codon:yes gene_type:complete